MKFGSAWPDANFELVAKTTEIAPGFHLIALVSEKPGTLELRELSLAIDTPEGLVLIVGCSHPGVERIMEAAAAIDRRIHLVAGGFHLLVAEDAESERIASVMRDTYRVQHVAPGHCTGEPTFAALQETFGSRYLYAGLGSVISLEGTARHVGHAPAHALDEDDRRSYRELLARSSDREDPLLAHYAR